MKSVLFCFVVLTVALMLTDREISIAVSQASQPQEILINELYTKENSLSYNAYDVIKIERQINFGYRELNYAVVKRNGKIQAKFDSVEHGLPHATDFGLFPFL